jgi:hypothetical protein
MIAFSVVFLNVSNEEFIPTKAAMLLQLLDIRRSHENHQFPLF